MLKKIDPAYRTAHFGKWGGAIIGRFDDRESWQQFFDTYGRFIFNIARKAGLSESEAEEVVQETVLGVAKVRVPSYACPIEFESLYIELSCDIFEVVR